MIFKFSKLVSQLKNTIITLILATLLLPAILYAADTDTQPVAQNNGNQQPFQKSVLFDFNYDPTYNFISNHEYLFAPLAGAIAGIYRCKDYNFGVKAGCAAIGGVLGTIDEIAIYSGFTNEHYLTWGALGIATGQIFNKPLDEAAAAAIIAPTKSDFIGLAAGILLPTGKLNSQQNIIAPIAAAITGSSIAGTSGMITGGIAGLLDTFLPTNNATENHYLTFDVAGMAIANSLSYLSPSLVNTIGIALGAIASKYKETILSTVLAPVKTANNLYTTYDKFIPKEQLDTHIKTQALALVGSQFLAQILSIKSLGNAQNMISSLIKLENPSPGLWSNFKSNTLYFAVFLIPCAMQNILTTITDNYFSKKLAFTLEDKIREELFSGETALRLSHDENATVPMTNLNQDISTAVYQGSSLTTDAISTSINGAYGVGIVIISSPNLLTYSILYHTIISKISEYLAAQQLSHTKEITVHNTQFAEIFRHDIANIRTITERDGTHVTNNKIQQVSNEIRKRESAQKMWSTANSAWNYISQELNWAFNLILTGNELTKENININQRLQMQDILYKISNLLSWPGKQAQNIATIGQSLERIIVIEGKIHTQQKGIDQIERIFTEDQRLTLKNLEVGFGNNTLVTVENLTLEMGKTYAITGKTGSGKTRLLYKIKGIKEDGSYGKGSISYPIISNKEPKILMMSQQDYFPLDSTLQQVISYPDPIPTDPELNNQQKKEITALLTEAADTTGLQNNCDEEDNDENKVNSSSLNPDSKETWYTRLSGGQKKIALIISVILKKPDILILDESFNGLDCESIIKIQQMLKKYLPNALILIVDHNANNHNYNSFYDGKLHLSKKTKTITLKNMPPRN